jgi:hypothetical protein
MKTKTVERLMNETPEVIKTEVSEYADWVVENNAYTDAFTQYIGPKYVGYYYLGPKALCIAFEKKPNWFHRTMMKVCLGWKWENDVKL